MYSWRLRTVETGDGPSALSSRIVPVRLPPQAEAPDEDLISLVYFYEADHDAVIESLQPAIGQPNDYAPVVSAQFLKKRLDAITIG